MPERSQEELDRIAKALSGSPFYRYLGMRVVRIWEGHSEMEMELEEKHKNIWNAVHGGVVASIMDSTCGTSLSSSLEPDESAVTIDLRVNYLSPPRPGLLTGKGKFIYRTRNLAWSEAKAYDQEGKLVAMAQAVHRIFKREGEKK